MDLSDRVPDARMCLFRERLTNWAVVRTFRGDAQIFGLHRHAGQIVDTSLIAAPHQHNTDEEKKAIKEGRIPAQWRANPAKLRHKDRDARWTVKFTKAKPREHGSKPVDLAVPLFGEPGLDRSWRWLHPQMDRDRRRSLRGAPARGPTASSTTSIARNRRSFHVVGFDQHAAIALRQKWSRPSRSALGQPPTLLSCSEVAVEFMFHFRQYLDRPMAAIRAWRGE